MKAQSLPLHPDAAALLIQATRLVTHSTAPDSALHQDTALREDATWLASALVAAGAKAILEKGEVTFPLRVELCAAPASLGLATIVPFRARASA